MQKWEYLEVIYADVVTSVNGKTIGEVGLLRAKGPKVWEFLNEMGQQGWEVVGLASWGDAGWSRVLLKRPLDG